MREISLSICLVAVLGCESSSSAVALTTRTDSAGVEIVRSRDVRTHQIIVDSVPDLSLGGPAAEGPEAFGAVENVVVAPDGSIWVSDRQAAVVQVFESNGSHRTTVGGRGSGPGEFRIIRLLGVAGDSVAVQDVTSGRLTWYGVEGELLSEARVNSPDGTNPLVYDVTTDGHLVGVQSETRSVSSIEPGSTYGGSVDFSLWRSPGEAPTQFTSEPTAMFVLTEGPSSAAIPFRANAAVDAGQQIHVVAGPEYEVRQFDSEGSLVRIARIDRRRSLVDASAKAKYRRFIEQAVPPNRGEAMLEVLQHPSVPDAASAYRLVVQGTDGSSWAYRFSASEPGEQPWDVFRPDGSFSGVATLPMRFGLRVVTEGFLYGIWTDDLGVHHVRRYSYQID